MARYKNPILGLYGAASAGLLGGSSSTPALVSKTQNQPFAVPTSNTPAVTYSQNYGTPTVKPGQVITPTYAMGGALSSSGNTLEIKTNYAENMPMVEAMTPNQSQPKATYGPTKETVGPVKYGDQATTPDPVTVEKKEDPITVIEKPDDTEKIPTYEEFAKDEENKTQISTQESAAADEKSKSALELIEEKRKATYAQAEAERQRAIVDANTAAAQNLATYGANAERLASMGLTGSGYSDYVSAATYAAQRGDIQAARVLEARAKLEADKVYYSDRIAQEEQSNANYLSLLDAAKSGGYTAEEIRSAAERMNISDEAIIGELTSAANSAKLSLYTSDITSATTDSDIERIAKEGGIDAETLREYRASAIGAEIESFISSGDLTSAADAIEKALREGKITDKTEKALTYKLISADIAVNADKGENVLKILSDIEDYYGSDSSEDKKKLINQLISKIPAEKTNVQVNIPIKTTQPVEDNMDKLLTYIYGQKEKGAALNIEGAIFVCLSSDGELKWRMMPAI
jgi:hypothetical protein